MDWIQIDSGGILRGSARVPGSKSIAQRWLLAASIAQGSTRLTALPGGEDVRSARQLIADAGAQLQGHGPAALTIAGRPPGPHRGWRSEQALDVGESGTLARLSTAIGAFCGSAGSRLEYQARGSLLRRRSAPLLASLRAAGVEIECLGIEGGWPLRLRPIGPPSELRLEHPVSSQEWSALMLALAAYPGETRLELAGELPSAPYAELTVRTLVEFGATVTREASSCLVRGPLRAPADPLRVEPDASAAAVALAAAVASGGEVTIEGLGTRSAQGDIRIVEGLCAMGVDCAAGSDTLRARGTLQRSVEQDLRATPDLAPVLAALAAVHAWQGGNPSRFTGLGTLPGKESSRIAVLAAGFSAAGIATRHGPDWLEVGPRLSAGSEFVRLDPHGDHRMAFAFALLGLARGGIGIAEPGCVAKSWPGFFEELQRLGARLATR